MIIPPLVTASSSFLNTFPKDINWNGSKQTDSKSTLFVFSWEDDTFLCKCQAGDSCCYFVCPPLSADRRLEVVVLSQYRGQKWPQPGPEDGGSALIHNLCLWHYWVTCTGVFVLKQENVKKDARPRPNQVDLSLWYDVSWRFVTIGLALYPIAFVVCLKQRSSRKNLGSKILCNCV